jgi:hypothetical protein
VLSIGTPESPPALATSSRTLCPEVGERLRPHHRCRPSGVPDGLGNRIAVCKSASGSGRKGIAADSGH